MDEEEEKKSLKIFGKEITNIPCFRNSYFYGIMSGLGGGLGYFMFTSKTRNSTHFGMATFFLTTMSYWTYCRWKHDEQLKQAQILKDFIQKRVVPSTDPSNEDMVGSV